MKNIQRIAVMAVAMMLCTTGVFAIELGDINVHGFISQGYLQTTDNNFMADTKDGTLEFNETGINFSTDLTNRLHLGVQFFAYDLGDEGNDEIDFDWAFADYRWRNEFGVRIGTMKLVSGLYGERRQLDMLRTGVFLPFSVYVGPWWESVSSLKGITLYGEIPLGNIGYLSYNAQTGIGKFSEDSGPAKVAEREFSELQFDVTEMDSDYTHSLSLEWASPFQNVKAKATYFMIDPLKFTGTGALPLPPIPASMPTSIMIPTQFIDTQVNLEMRVNISVLSVEYRWNDLVLAAEYNSIYAKPRLNLNLGQGWQDNPSQTSEGWYLSAAYRLTDWFEVGLWYSEFYPDEDDKQGEKQAEYDFEAWQKTITLSSRFDLNDYWIVKLEASYNDGFGAYNIADNLGELERYWMLYALKVTYNF
jgi:hypothetical protein